MGGRADYQSGVLRRLLQDERGGVAILFMFLATGLFGFVALAIDTSMWYSSRNRMQGAADAGARAGAYALQRLGSTPSDIEAAARADAAKNGFGSDTGATVNVTVDPTEQKVHVAISAPGRLTFARLFVDGSPTLRAQAAAAAPSSPPPCLTILAPAAPHALDMTTGGRIVAPTCRIQVNSTSGSAIGLGGGAYIAAAQVCVAGGVSGTGTSVPPTTGCPPLVDPMSSWVPPAMPEACDHTQNKRYKGTIALLFPGTYCGDITVEDHAVVTFSPGIYYLKNSILTVSNYAKVAGLGVGFLLTDGSKIYIDKFGEASFTAPITGPMAGIIFAHDSNAVEDKVHKLSDGQVRYEGAIYLPRQGAKYKSNSVSTNIPPFTTYIVKQMTIETGSSVLLSDDYVASEVPVVGKIGSGVVLVQ